MYRHIKRLFEKPSAQSLAVTELEHSRRALLQQQAAAEYHAKLVEYYTVKIKRLNHYVSDTK